MQQLLMIEDDARLAQMVGEYLERSGFTVAKAVDAKAGLEASGEAKVAHRQVSCSPSVRSATARLSLRLPKPLDS